METQLHRHVRVICDLKIGDTVRTRQFSYKLDNRHWIIEDIKWAFGSSESGVLVKISGYESYIDSNWLAKV